MNEFVEDLKSKVFCRIAPSPIHGVGVFAIRSIPKGINPMQENRTFEFQQVPVKEVMDDPDLPASVKKLVVDMNPENDGYFDCPPFSLNEIGVSYYLNHSKTPNMGEDGDGNFITLRDIAEGEELTVDYSTYGELNL
jgi:SET domain-containing protein